MYDEHGAKYRQEQARAYLESVRDAKRHLKAKTEQAAALLEDAEGVKAVVYDKPMVQSSAYGDAIPDAIAAVEAARDAALQAAGEFADIVQECNIALQSLGGWQADLLDLHYISGIKLVDIIKRDEWTYSVDYISVMHLQALEDFYDHMPHWRRERLEPAI